MSSYSRQQLESWLKSIRISDSKILDVGGSQLPIGGRLGLNNNNTFTILDLPNPHEKKADVHIEMDLNYPDVIVRPENEQFDAAFCLEVSEYLWNPIQAFTNIYRLLKSGARFYVSFHFVYPVHNPQHVDFLRYTEFGAKKVLSESGFKIDDIKWRTSNGSHDLLWSFYQSEKMKPSKDYVGHELIGCLITAVKPK